MRLFRTLMAREKLRRLHALLEEPREEIGYLEACRREVEKWRLIHDLIRAHPFPTAEYKPRSQQWRDAFDLVRDIGDREFCDWVLLQIEVAENIERGVREMRPRKPGPCHAQLLEFAAQRLAKAEKILRFATEGERNGGVLAVDGDWHRKTAEILKKARRAYRPYDHGGHEDVPWPSGDETDGGS